ncbi:protein of unknown function [Candidatus Promineifilum breve]|uniref:LysM domain-containing protein n=1 Tax=Candidatus Promineifilum breve TaxID=1806508 RepID=A0A160T380_9CHLR|nr:LysM peptidoglycan-binding domain-containing protein [Candidatus Promineifilum breve]CUS04132.2 protein of unknown function [Candidatus Promineifilum breve]
MASNPNRKGCGARLPQLIFTVIVAILLAMVVFWAIPFLQGRPELPSGTNVLQVEGNLIRVVMDPNQEVFLVPLGGIGTGTGGQTITQLPSPTPNILATVAATATTQVLPTAPPPVPATATARPANSCIAFTGYTVVAGDTLFSISRKFVTSIVLMARHGISSASLLPGAALRIPVGDPACCAGGWRPYVVEEGETWFGIAQQCGTTVDSLLQGNGLGAGAPLYMASVICVPAN